ncbi:MAG: hypothetical protein ACK42L_07000 [Thermoanaerobaculum sp.]
MDRLSRKTVFELVLLACLACANVVSEVLGSGKAVVVAAGVVLWGSYLAWRGRREPGLWRKLLWPSKPQAQGLALLAAFTGVGVLLSVLVGVLRGAWPPPASFWLILVIYPVWGTAQQFLLNTVLAQQLRSLLPPGWAHFLAASGFAVAHAPDWPVVAATFPAALVWVWIYPRLPQLPLLGTAHGMVGTVFFYSVLGRDPAHALGRS